MDYKLDGYCGLYCGACPVLIANQDDTLETLAERFGMEIEALRCAGCKSAKTAAFCTDCGLKRCARDRGFDFCFECRELPCEPFIAFRDDVKYPYHLATPKNLARIQEVGVETWLEEQDSRWRCPACGTRFAWQEETCRACGSAVPNYQADL